MILKRLKSFFSNISIDCAAACVYLLCLPFTIVTTPFGSLLKVITMPVTALLTYKLFVGKRKQLRLNSVHFVYSLYIIYTLFGLFLLVSENAVVHTRDMALTFAVMMLITARVYNQYEKKLIEDTWIVVGLICVYLCLTSTEVANQFESRTIVYIFGFEEDPNQFCAYFIMPAMLCIKRVAKKNRFAPLYLALVVLILYAVLKTGSRGGLIGIVAGIAFCIILGVKSFKAKVGFLIAGALCVVLVVTVIFPALPDDVQQRYSVERVMEDKGSGRFDIWRYLIFYTAENPARFMRGSGLLSTYETLAAANVSETARVAHNQFVQVLADQGLIGLTIFMALIAVCCLRPIKKNPYYTCAFISVMAFSVSLTFYVFKPYINLIIMCAMNFENINAHRKGAKNEATEKNDKNIAE